MKSHKLLDIILFSLTIVFFVIGVHQTVIYDIGRSYWLFMFCFGTLAWYNIRKMNREKQQKKTVTNKSSNLNKAKRLKKK